MHLPLENCYSATACLCFLLLSLLLSECTSLAFSASATTTRVISKISKISVIGAETSVGVDLLCLLRQAEDVDIDGKGPNLLQQGYCRVQPGDSASKVAKTLKKLRKRLGDEYIELTTLPLLPLLEDVTSSSMADNEYDSEHEYENNNDNNNNNNNNNENQMSSILDSSDVIVVLAKNLNVNVPVNVPVRGWMDTISGINSIAGSDRVGQDESKYQYQCLSQIQKYLSLSSSTSSHIKIKVLYVTTSTSVADTSADAEEVSRREELELELFPAICHLRIHVHKNQGSGKVSKGDLNLDTINGAKIKPNIKTEDIRDVDVGVVRDVGLRVAERLCEVVLESLRPQGDTDIGTEIGQTEAEQIVGFEAESLYLYI